MLNKDDNLRDQQLKRKKLVCKFRQEDGNLSSTVYPYKSNPKGGGACAGRTREDGQGQGLPSAFVLLQLWRVAFFIIIFYFF